jgi:hypothetical protein
MSRGAAGTLHRSTMTRRHPPSRSPEAVEADIHGASSRFRRIGLVPADPSADVQEVSERIKCTGCGSVDLVASGVFEHGTWTHRLTCWTCRDCQSVVAVREEEVASEGTVKPKDGQASSDALLP